MATHERVNKKTMPSVAVLIIKNKKKRGRATDLQQREHNVYKTCACMLFAFSFLITVLAIESVIVSFGHRAALVVFRIKFQLFCISPT